MIGFAMIALFVIFGAAALYRKKFLEMIVSSVTNSSGGIHLSARQKALETLKFVYRAGLTHQMIMNRMRSKETPVETPTDSPVPGNNGKVDLSLYLSQVNLSQVIIAGNGKAHPGRPPETPDVLEGLPPEGWPYTELEGKTVYDIEENDLNIDGNTLPSGIETTPGEIENSGSNPDTSHSLPGGIENPAKTGAAGGVSGAVAAASGPAAGALETALAHKAGSGADSAAAGVLSHKQDGNVQEGSSAVNVSPATPETVKGREAANSGVQPTIDPEPKSSTAGPVKEPGEVKAPGITDRDKPAATSPKTAQGSSFRAGVVEQGPVIPPNRTNRENRTVRTNIPLSKPSTKTVKGGHPVRPVAVQSGQKAETVRNTVPDVKQTSARAGVKTPVQAESPAPTGNTVLEIIKSVKNTQTISGQAGNINNQAVIPEILKDQ